MYKITGLKPQLWTVIIINVTLNFWKWGYGSILLLCWDYFKETKGYEQE